MWRWWFCLRCVICCLYGCCSIVCLRRFLCGLFVVCSVRIGGMCVWFVWRRSIVVRCWSWCGC